jgi:hypothetical protein
MCPCPSQCPFMFMFTFKCELCQGYFKGQPSNMDVNTDLDTVTDINADTDTVTDTETNMDTEDCATKH